jgi:hypothetical protein
LWVEGGYQDLEEEECIRLSMTRCLEVEEAKALEEMHRQERDTIHWDLATDLNVVVGADHQTPSAVLVVTTSYNLTGILILNLYNVGV